MLDIRQRTGYLFLAVMVGHVILISAQVQTHEGARVLESVTFGLFAGVQQSTSGIVDGWRGALVRVHGAPRPAAGERGAQAARVGAPGASAGRARARAAVSEQLQQLLDMKSATPERRTVAADVIAGDATPGIPSVWIDKGERDGVRPDMAVIAPPGVVGRVIGPLAPSAARVQLIIGQNAGAGAMIERSRAGGVIVGRPDDPPLADGVRVEPVRRPDRRRLVVTAGHDGIYPKGFAIGRVESRRARRRALQDDQGSPGRRFFERRGGARRAAAAARASIADGRGQAAMKTAVMLFAIAVALALQIDAGALLRWAASRWSISSSWPSCTRR